MKKQISQEFKIGLVTILCAVILFVGIDYLKGINLFKPDNYYYVKYKNVTGLAVSAPVTIDGFKVGLIRSIDYDYNNPGNVIVEISLDKKLKVPAGSKAVINSDLLGTAGIELQLNQYVKSMHAVSDTLVGEYDPGLMGTVDKIVPQVENLLPRIDSILAGLDQIINHAGLKETFQNVNSLTAELEKSSKGLTKMMNNDMPVIMKNVKSMTSNFNEMSESMKKIQFEETIASINTTLANVNKVTGQLNSKDNTIGLLLNSDGLYQSLNHTVASADSLVVDLKKNPKRYVHFSIFGKK